MPLRSPSRPGPTRIRDRYSLTRRARLRGRSTRQIWLKLPSTCSAMDTAVKNRNSKADAGQHVALGVVNETDDALRELGASLAERAEKLEQERLQLAVKAEGLEHRETDREERNHRQDRDVHEPHGVQRQRSRGHVPQHRVDEPDDGDRGSRRRRQRCDRADARAAPRSCGSGVGTLRCRNQSGRVSRSRAWRYLAVVRRMISAGSSGPGAFLSQSRVSR